MYYLQLSSELLNEVTLLLKKVYKSKDVAV